MRKPECVSLTEVAGAGVMVVVQVTPRGGNSGLPVTESTVQSVAGWWEWQTNVNLQDTHVHRGPHVNSTG